LQVGIREVQALLDRGQRDVHDGRVEDDHELREADDDEDEPAVGFGLLHAELLLSGSSGPLTVAQVD
jgi:hypothetical protein